MLDPAIWDSEQVMQLSPLGFKLYVYLISQADDEGRLAACFALMTSRVFPFGGANAVEVESLVKDMDKIGLIIMYTFEGKDFIQHPNWTLYQKIDRPTKSHLPAPVSLVEDSSSSTGALVSNRIEENRKEEKVEGKPSSALIQEVVQYLNTKTGREFKANRTSTATHIRARFRDGFSLTDFEAVIDAKVKEWGGDPKMTPYLRPETLFGTKFESYVQVARTGKTVSVEAQKEKHPCPLCGKGCTYEYGYWVCGEHGRDADVG
jgi:uncharacterized phage protein (TIGR02220 family)